MAQDIKITPLVNDPGPAAKPRRAYSRLNWKVIKEGLKQGMSMEEAGRLAGSKAKRAGNSVGSVIKHNPRLKKTIIALLEERQRWLLEAMKKRAIKSAALTQQSVSFGILTEKLQLLKGDPTTRLDIMPKMVFDEAKSKPAEGSDRVEMPKFGGITDTTREEAAAKSLIS